MCQCDSWLLYLSYSHFFFSLLLLFSCHWCIWALNGKHHVPTDDCTLLSEREHTFTLAFTHTHTNQFYNWLCSMVLELKDQMKIPHCGNRSWRDATHFQSTISRFLSFYSIFFHVSLFISFFQNHHILLHIKTLYLPFFLPSIYVSMVCHHN